MDILNVITALSHEFGTSDYVRGGGGNTSCKTDQTLWVKPSGTTLKGLQPDLFVALDRGRLSELYRIETPADSSAREALVKEMMEKAALPDTSGRASVEAPLHDSLDARYVVHTHPFIVNGMTCSRQGAAVCRELFPTALWLDYIDPGYTLCMQVRKEIEQYKQQNGAEPSVIFLKNHGVFVAGDEPDEIRRLYGEIMSALTAQYHEVQIPLELTVGDVPDTADSLKQIICDVMGDSASAIAAEGFFHAAVGPITPDHIVYAKSYPFLGTPTTERMEAFQAAHGYPPQVVAFDQAVFGVADNEKSATLALELAADGALVEQLARAFGGIDYMTDRQRDFIENWEVESYRKKQMQQ